MSGISHNISIRLRFTSMKGQVREREGSENKAKLAQIAQQVDQGPKGSRVRPTRSHGVQGQAYLCICHIFYFHLHLGSNLFLVNVENVQKYIHECTVFLAFASRGVLMKHPISLRAIIPCNHSPQTPLNCDPSFEIVNLAAKRTYCHIKQIKGNILIICIFSNV